MTSRRKNLLERKDRVLSIAVTQYIQTVSPVSSNCIVREYMSDFSSATIRNILAELEFDGYLTHPHTSAGRVPTQKGYRYYVDHLMDEIHILAEEKARIKVEYEREQRELESLLEKTSELITHMTQYTSIISIDGCENKLFCHGTGFVVGYPEYQDLNKIQSILETLDEKKNLLEVINRTQKGKIEVLIGEEIACDDIDSCSLVVSQYQSKNGASGRLAVLGPTRMNYNRVIGSLEYLSDVLEEVL